MMTDTNNRNTNNQNNPNDDDPQASMGKGMMITAWILALALLTWIFGAWEQQQYHPNRSPQSMSNNGVVEVSLKRNRQGHYLVNGSVNQKPATFMLDTGATLVAIPGEIQKSLGLISGQLSYSHTANGTAKTYATHIDELTIGEITLYDIDASIVPNMQGEQILLGMSVLKQLEFSQKGQHLTLRQLN